MPPRQTQPTFRSNPEVDAKIDAYIKENPKYWAYVQAMPRERLERTVVLNEVRELDRQQRIREGVLKQINRNPELKRAYDLLVKDLPGGPEGERHRPNRPSGPAGSGPFSGAAGAAEPRRSGHGLTDATPRSDTLATECWPGRNEDRFSSWTTNTACGFRVKHA